MSGIKSSKIFTLSERKFPFLKLNSTFITDSGTDKDAKLYINRVIADGGTIVNAKLIDAVIKQAKKDGWYSSCKLWFAGFGGYKVVGAGVAVWYNMAGSQVSGVDAIQTTDALKPLFTTSVAVQNNMPGLRFDNTATDNGRTLSIPAAETLFPNEGSLFTSHWADSDDLYSVFGTHSTDDQWWRVGGGGQYPGVWRNARVGGLGSASVYSGNQYTTIISNTSIFKQYQNGTLNFSTTADYYAGNAYSISDANGRSDRALRGYITEIIALNVTASADVQAAIELMIKTRYAL